GQEARLVAPQVHVHIRVRDVSLYDRVLRLLRSIDVGLARRKSPVFAYEQRRALSPLREQLRSSQREAHEPQRTYSRERFPHTHPRLKNRVKDSSFLAAFWRGPEPMVIRWYERACRGLQVPLLESAGSVCTCEQRGDNRQDTLARRSNRS